MLAESYRVLQVPLGAQMPEVRRAYRQLVLQYHPDRNHAPGANEMFLRVQAAYEFLQGYHSQPAAFYKPPVASPPSAKSKAEQDWEKYQYVYEPPADPKEFAAWAEVGKERVRRQAKKDHEMYILRTLAMKAKWWYPLARLVSYLVLCLGTAFGLAVLLTPVMFGWAGYFYYSYYYRFILLGVIIMPIGWRVLQMMKDLRQDIKYYFGEDLPASKL
ncbi:DnaJ domain-containing protein [Nibribacter ruber]|uniref:DnaJ domain-containing protein n=1 Tax=Nibribacter ruber TaxID=2698458 RepID=A0A6P1P020_9BACT|nr:J domain-containing protein [Nibribacter ruber]QHL87618.1 DnaJ domain-containing protein [Nibribacter ruber]